MNNNNNNNNNTWRPHLNAQSSGDSTSCGEDLDII